MLKLWRAIRRKCPGQLAREVLLHWQCQTPYSPSNPGENSGTAMLTSWKFALQLGLGLSDFHLFGLLRNHLGGKRFTDEEVATEVRKWLINSQKTSVLRFLMHW
jgi:hypothetical protein